MKKQIHIIFAVILAAVLFLLASCGGTSNTSGVSWSDIPATEEFTETSAISIKGSSLDSNAWAFWTKSLDEKFWNQTVTIKFSCDMTILAPEDSGHIMWQVNTNGKYPKIATVNFDKNDSSVKHVNETVEVTLGSSPVFYLSTYNEDESAEKFQNLSSFEITVTNFKLVIDYTDRVPVGLKEEDYWLKAQSLKEVFADSGIEHIGFAVTGNELLSDSEKAKGLAYHATTTTMGNEFKPDFLFNWALNSTTGKQAQFTASNGLTIDVPSTLKGFTNADKYLSKCKELGIKMRGHVLVWYSQTPKAFFCEDYDSKKGFVDKDTMTARQEWYIKTVLDHVAQWEEENMEGGKHLIYTWDVVNEALSDGAKAGAYLRSTTNSNWAAIYGAENYEFIINAFRFANKYAPKDVLLAYNDYNEASGEKFNGYLKIIDEIKNHEKDAELPTRIDIAGMQSHNQPSYPSYSEYETAIKSFIQKGLDVQVTELDITGSAVPGTNYQEFYAPSASEQKATYKKYFELYLKYAKTEGKEHGVTGVTIWGINDEDSWRSSGEPLLFRKIGNKYYVKDAYYGVLEAKK